MKCVIINDFLCSETVYLLTYAKMQDICQNIVALIVIQLNYILNCL